MAVIVADGEQAAVHLGVQRLHPAVHHLGKPGDVGDVDHLQACVRQGLGGPAGGDDLDAVPGEPTGEIHKPALVGNRQQRAGDRTQALAHNGNSGSISASGRELVSVRSRWTKVQCTPEVVRARP